MNIKPIASKGQMATYHFGQLNVAAGAAGLAIPIAGVAGADTGETMVFSGDIVGVGWHLSVAGSAGVFTIAVTVNGTAIAAAYTLTVGTAVKGFIKIPRDKVRLLAGDVLGVKITTDGLWNGVTGDLAVTVNVLHALEGI